MKESILQSQSLPPERKESKEIISRVESQERLSPVIERAQEVLSLIEDQAEKALPAGKEEGSAGKSASVLRFAKGVSRAAERAAFRVFNTVREYVRRRHSLDFKTEAKSLLKTPRWRLPYEITEFKKSLSEQQEALAALREDIVRIVHEDPDVSPDFLKEYVDQAALASHLSEKHQIFAHKLINIYAEKHQVIASYIEKYPDIHDLFEALFGKKPNGRIAVIRGPMTLYFRCHSLFDYAYIRSLAFLKKRNVTAGDLFLAKMSGGVTLLGSRIPELEGLVMVENAFGYPGGLDGVAYGTLTHEEQHVMHYFFDQEMRHIIRFGPLGRAQSANEMREAIALHLRSHRRKFEERAKDEILAYLIMLPGPSPTEIFQYLTTPKGSEGLYDYFENESEKRIIDSLRENLPEKYRSLVDSVAADTFKVDAEEYKKMIRKGIFAALDLKDHRYSKEKIAALLGGEELRRWPRVVKRILSVTHESPR